MGIQVVFYCNNEGYTGYYFSTMMFSDGAMKEQIGGNIIDDELCGDIEVELYCSDSSYIGYYNVNQNGDYDYNLGHNSGNILDFPLCIDTIDKYCDNPDFVGYYLGDSVGVQYVGTIIDNIETCGDSA